MTRRHDRAPSRDPLYLSAHASFVGIASIAMGVADAALIASGRLGAGGAFEYVPLRLWAVAPLCWAAVAILLALPSYAAAPRRAPLLIAAGMIVLFVAARFYTASPAWVIAGLAAAVAASLAAWLVGVRWLGARKRFAAAATATTFVALLTASTGTETAAGARLPRAAAATAPDVVVVFIDTLPYDSVFTLGSVDGGLPFLRRLAEEGVVFDRAYTPSPWTLPAHLAAVTGVPAHRLGIGFDDQRYSGTAVTLPDRFRRRGYRTVAVISNTFLNRGTGFQRGFDVYDHASSALDVCRTAPGRLLDRWNPWFAASVCNWTAAEVTRRAIEHAAAADRPLFLLLNYMDTHDPYYVERGCERARGGNPLPLRVHPSEYRRRYYGSHLAALRCIDNRLGRLTAALERRGRGVVMAVLSDHGEQFGERGLVRHGNSLYRTLLHVPLIIKAPGVEPRHVAEPTSIEDLTRLLLDIMERRVVSRSERAIIASLIPPRSEGAPEQWSIIRGRWHLIQNGARVELFDLLEDPGERNDLATATAAAPIVRELLAELSREMRSRVNPRAGEFRSLGYVR